MTTGGYCSDNDETILVQIPLQLRQRGGRKLVLAPHGTSPLMPPRARMDSALVKAVARAYRWRRMLEVGIYGTITELAAAEKINQSYVCRILRLTLLAPDLIEAILNGSQWPCNFQPYLNLCRPSGAPSVPSSARQQLILSALHALERPSPPADFVISCCRQAFSAQRIDNQ